MVIEFFFHRKNSSGRSMGRWRRDLLLFRLNCENVAYIKVIGCGHNYIEFLAFIFEIFGDIEETAHYIPYLLINLFCTFEGIVPFMIWWVSSKIAYFGYKQIYWKQFKYFSKEEGTSISGEGVFLLFPKSLNHCEYIALGVSSGG